MIRNAHSSPAVQKCSVGGLPKQLLWSMVCALGLLFLQNSWSQDISALGFQRIPSSATFEPWFAPFQSVGPLQQYGAMGQEPGVVLHYLNGKKEKFQLDGKSLRLTAAPEVSASSKTAPLTDREKRSYSVQDVRDLWTNRHVLSAWLDFDGATETLRQRLKEKGSLPVGTRIQALAGATYAEISTAAGAVVLKSEAGVVITPEPPALTAVEPLFHGLFIGCTATSSASRVPIAQEILGNRAKSGMRCGFMGEAGNWLVRPDFDFMEYANGWGRHLGDGPFVLLLRGDEPCIANLRLPVSVTCLGQPLSSLFGNGRLPFAVKGKAGSRNGGDVLGYLGRDGTWAIAPKFREAQGFSGKVATVSVAGLPGIIDGAGKWLTPSVPSDPIAARWLSLRGSSQSDLGLIDRSGKMVIPFLFPGVERATGTSFRLCHQNGCDVVPVPRAQKQPRVLPVPPQQSVQAIETAAAWIPSGENGRWGYKDSSGQWVLPPRFEEAEPFEQGLAKVKSKDQWGIIQPNGKWLYQPLFQWISPLENGVAVAQNSTSKQVLLRADGKRVDVPEGVYLVDMFQSDGLAIAAGPDRLMGYLDRSGQWAIPPSFSSANRFFDDYAVVGGKVPEDWRPAKFTEPPYVLQSVHWLSPHLLALRVLIGKEVRYGLMDNEGHWLMPAR